MNVSIRPATPDDFAPMAAWLVTIPLWQRYRLNAEKAAHQFVTAHAEGDILLAADHAIGGAACGFAWCMPRGAFGRSAYLRLIGVRPDCGRLGIGAALLETVEHHARALTGDLILLVSDFNTDAQRFYARHGYERIGAIPGYVLPDVTEYILRKQLV